MTELSTKKTINEIRKAVDGVFSEDPQVARKAAICVCHRYSGKRLKEIGACFGVGESAVGESAVSQTSRRFLVELEKNKAMRRKMRLIQKKLGLSSV